MTLRRAPPRNRDGGDAHCPHRAPTSTDLFRYKGILNVKGCE